MKRKRSILRQSLPDVIADDVRERILSGELAEGESIRQEALAEEYGVSRMPIREALKRLDAEGLVQLANNKGASVIKHSLREIGEIFELRKLIEVELFRLAIPKMKAADFKRCHQLLDAMAQSYANNDVAKWGSLNFEYHSALYSAAERKLTNELLQRINLQCDRYVRMHLSVMKQLQPAKDDHHKLLSLAEKQAVEEACDVLANHITRTRGQLLTMIAEKRGGKEAEAAAD